MKAVIRRGASLVLDEIPDPVPGTGQVLVETRSCGICGSDLHALHHADLMTDYARRTGSGMNFDSTQDVVFGHEFSAEILDYGPGTQAALPVGTNVCAMPVVTGSVGAETVGYSNNFPGGFGQRMVLQSDLLLEIPNGLSTEYAALTEPMAVGAHAVVKAQMTNDDVALVVGCGPVGLAVIAALKAAGFGPVMAADFSPARRRLAERMGADVLIDPAQRSPYDSWEQMDVPTSGQARTVLEEAGRVAKNAVIFECVGVPGVINQIIEGAPTGTRIIVVGVCMEADQFEPYIAVVKELDFRFVVAYSGDEFAHSLRQIAEGEIDVSPLITGKVRLDGVADAFEDLASPEKHAKILVQPNG